MIKFRAALIAAALAFVVAGSAGVAATSQAEGTSTGTVVVSKVKGGEGWCC